MKRTAIDHNDRRASRRSLLRGRARTLAATAAIAAAAVSPGANAERWAIETGVSTQATWTSNGAFQASGVQQEDVVLDVTPSLTVVGEGARLRIRGAAAVTALRYVNGSQDSTLRPEADLLANLEAVERFFFIEGAYRATQTQADPYGARPAGATAFNTFTSTQARISPYIERQVSPTLRYLVRSDNTWTEDYDSDVALQDVYFGRHVIQLERSPVPFGWVIQLERTDTDFKDTLQPTLTTDLARLIGSYALSPELRFGLRAGYEWNNYMVGDDDEGAIYGAGGVWRPSERTNLEGFWERRFFGSGWSLGFTHRNPRIAWNVATSRDISSFAQQLFALPPTGDVLSLLDAIFTTRFPDPTERARIVQEVIRRQGLPTGIGRATNIYAPRISLLTSSSGTVTFIGTRTTLALSLFATRSEDLVDTTGFPIGDVALTNNKQEGAGIAYGHQLSTLLGVSASMSWSNIRGLGIASGAETKQRTARVAAVRPLGGPRTTATLGARYQELRSTTEPDSHEAAVFVGLAHTF